MLSDTLAYARLGNVKTALPRTRSRTKLGGESSDDNDETNEQFSSIHNYAATMIRPGSSKSTMTTNERFDKPLPPVPRKVPSKEQLTQTR